MRITAMCRLRFHIAGFALTLTLTEAAKRCQLVVSFLDTEIAFPCLGGATAMKVRNHVFGRQHHVSGLGIRCCEALATECVAGILGSLPHYEAQRGFVLMGHGTCNIVRVDVELGCDLSGGPNMLQSRLADIGDERVEVKQPQKRG